MSKGKEKCEMLMLQYSGWMKNTYAFKSREFVSSTGVETFSQAPGRKERRT